MKSTTYTRIFTGVEYFPSPALPLENFSLSAFLEYVGRTSYYECQGELTRFDSDRIWMERSIDVEKMSVVDGFDEWGRCIPYLVGADSIGNSLYLPKREIDDYLERTRSIKFDSDRGVVDDMVLGYEWAIDLYCNFLVVPEWLKK